MLDRHHWEPSLKSINKDSTLFLSFQGPDRPSFSSYMLLNSQFSDIRVLYMCTGPYNVWNNKWKENCLHLVESNLWYIVW